MDKSLEALEIISNNLEELYAKNIIVYPFRVEKNIIEKEFKALEIIRKHCEFGKTIPLPNIKTYYDLLVSELTQEEYELLKEVLL